MNAKRQLYKTTLYPSRRTPGKVFVHPQHEQKDGEGLAAALMTLIGGDVKFLPELHIPNIKNPDCEWQNLVWEIKTLRGDSYETTRDAIHKGTRQSCNLVINAYLTKRDFRRVLGDVCHYFKDDPASYRAQQILVLGKKEYSLIKRSMIK